jgi:hypothetical protein
VGDKNKGQVKPHDYNKLMEQGYKLNLKYAPKLVASDLALRNQFDQPLTDQAMAFQEKNDPRFAQEQYDALERRDPQWVAAHQVFGEKGVHRSYARGTLQGGGTTGYGGHLAQGHDESKSAARCDSGGSGT